MITLIGLLVTAISNAIPSVFGWLNKKQDTSLAGAQAAFGTDLEIAKATLQANLQTELLKATQNNWIGAKIIAGTAGELSAFYYGSIVLDSIFHLGWNIAKLPVPWDGYAWIILSSFIIVSPVAPVLAATSAWLGRR
jgi:hypothetical protein